jgi:hypothetical protein
MASNKPPIHQAIEVVKNVYLNLQMHTFFAYGQCAATKVQRRIASRLKTAERYTANRGTTPSAGRRTTHVEQNPAHNSVSVSANLCCGIARSVTVI